MLSMSKDGVRSHKNSSELVSQRLGQRLIQVAETLQSILGPPAKLIFTYIFYTFLNIT